eukprot:CAMPEP_0175066878 /NCGR_PEP_ID=MMETSP0052_2-20121109/16768_1 /TAXON_ID=51329 ORGANISM="Polytomella parva, Strain SAG 63-3" /NCGR_SAMPLE_ID=MMETSP0052_2 /ASSEMBLY_ACC=CAM_ASM_000194 /LENGTH=204 /DNA_ID=CAMNT_0016333659 /DNA_START=39 /DNA_END=653 /DNA_ORIENTATION=-
MLGTARREKKVDTTVFGYESPPDMPVLNRDVFKWIQSLDLSQSIRNVRRDTANGFLVAQIFSRYFPSEVQLHSYANVTSTANKRDNWIQIQKLCAKQGISLPADLVDGTLLGVHGAAVALLEHLYELFTGKKVQRVKVISDADAQAALLAAGREGAGGNFGDQVDAFKTISSNTRAAVNLEFGHVSTSEAGDALAVRKRMAMCL